MVRHTHTMHTPTQSLLEEVHTNQTSHVLFNVFEAQNNFVAAFRDWIFFASPILHLPQHGLVLLIADETGGYWPGKFAARTRLQLI